MTIIGKVECPACGEKTFAVSEGKAGQLPGRCINEVCRFQGWVKTPTGAARLRERLKGGAGSSSQAPASGAPEKKGDDGAGFRIDKL